MVTCRSHQTAGMRSSRLVLVGWTVIHSDAFTMWCFRAKEEQSHQSPRNFRVIWCSLNRWFILKSRFRKKQVIAEVGLLMIPSFFSSIGYSVFCSLRGKLQYFLKYFSDFFTRLMRHGHRWQTTLSDQLASRAICSIWLGAGWPGQLTPGLWLLAAGCWYQDGLKHAKTIELLMGFNWDWSETQIQLEIAHDPNP